MDEDRRTRIEANAAAVRRRIAAAASAAGRDPHEVSLLLAVKTQPAEDILAALRAGAHLLGHNRAQELAATGPALAVPGVPAHEMHFIGHLQGNKVNQVLRWATCVQTVDSLRLAQRLDQAVARAAGSAGADAAAGVGTTAADGGGTPVLDVFVQVNTSGEPTKAGTHPDEAPELTAAVGALPHLRLRGFMTVGAHSDDDGVVRESYERLAALRGQVLASGAPGTAGATELSMGMSGDLEIAVAAGATMVRVGTAVFGARPTPEAAGA
ncbi:YggS family pyridoxal phosphate-dependent enzyme [Georgenia sp. SYP-B2076]|uniref:YggS family pyridoxal phosphate-dependent enzyme n=1 Tax=Georgenia sp. SYP-B2076 TaxID=2495881 RepID=UPI001F0C8F17|nr:YggS family pyridoxal phosphate-dependent enzyme [Georgenia sp. SYP-B2076]